ncbi:MAG: DUF1254 domain-containing protein [Hyphomicrobiales bacterium]|nr:DUF1254 domain-containing protein [Hyphomicrobiales bacterium]
MLMILRYVLSLWPWFVASLLAAGVIHISAVFSVPYVATQDAWARLTKISGSNELSVLPVAESDMPLPFMAPDIAYAFCHYDLSERNVTVETPLGDASWTIAVSGRYGENYYFISGAEAKRRELRLLIVPRARLAQEISTELSQEGEEQIIVIAPALTGLVVIRAPIRGPSFRAQTVNLLKGAKCGLLEEEIIDIDPATLSKGLDLPEKRSRHVPPELL